MQIDYPSLLVHQMDKPLPSKDNTLVLVYFGCKGSGKNLAADYTSEYISMSPMVTQLSFANPLKTKFPFLKGTYWTGRLLLQFYGTEIYRSTYDNVWIDKMKGSLEQAHRIGLPVISITDCRFPNEYEMLASLPEDKYSVKFIRIDRPWLGERNDPHVSESNWKQFKYNDLVFNDTSKEDFKLKIEQLVEKYL
jgi:hypothetical protein